MPNHRTCCSVLVESSPDLDSGTCGDCGPFSSLFFGFCSFITVESFVARSEWY